MTIANGATVQLVGKIRYSTQQIDDGVLPPQSDASGNHAFPEAPLRCPHPRKGKRALVAASHPAIPIRRLQASPRALFPALPFADKTQGPTAGTEKLDPLEFLARLVTHIPDKRQVMTRYYGRYANRPRGTRKKLAGDSATIEQPINFAEREDLTLKESKRRKDQARGTRR